MTHVMGVDWIEYNGSSVSNSTYQVLAIIVIDISCLETLDRETITDSISNPFEKSKGYYK